MTSTCTACHLHPVHDTFVCQGCADDYHGNLAVAPMIAAELVVEVAKMSRKGRTPSGHVRRTEQPLIFDPQASAALDKLRGELVSAVRIVALDDQAAMPVDTVSAMCHWLTRMEQAVALRPEGGDIVTGLADAIGKGRRIIDIPPEKRFVGDCPCGSPTDPSRLLAVVGSEYVTCRRCGTGYRVAECIGQLEDAMRDHLVTRPELERLLKVPPSTLHAWISRDQRLLSSGTDREGKPLYRYGDALNLNEIRKARSA